MEQRLAMAATARCVGRESELARLAEIYRETQQGGQRFVLLEGPSGVGKSRILHEFRGRIRLSGGVVLDGRCEPGEAFGPFADIVEQSLRFLDEVGVAPGINLDDLSCRNGCHRFWYQHGSNDGAPSDAVPAFMPVRGPEIEALEKRLRFFDAVYGLLRDVAAIRAPVVMLQDLERADRGTVQLLQFILEGAGPLADEVRAERGVGALFVASVRSDSGQIGRAPLTSIESHDATARVQVGELDADGVRAFLQAPETVARIMERTGGMPEAIELLLSADPLTPEQLLARQLGELPVPARALVEALAVVAHPSDVELLARVADVALDSASRTAFGESDLVQRSIVNGRILFSIARESIRERLYDLLREEQRRELHARCVGLFAGRGATVLDAARHALRAGLVERAVPLALSAARSLAARHAHGEAAALLEEVCKAAPSEPPIMVHEALADLYRLSGDYRQALDHAESVLRRCPGSANATQRVGDLLTLAGRLDDAARVLEDAHQLAAAGEDPSLTIEVEALLAELHYQRASYGEAREWAERALSAAEALDELPLSIHARNTLGKLALAQAEPHVGAALFEENYRQASTAGLGHQMAQALTNLGVALLRRQDLAAAKAAFERAIEVAAGAQESRDRAIATENLAVLAHLRRDFGTALGYYHDAVALLKRLGNRAMLARIANNLGELYLSLGERSRARALCEFATHMGGTGLPPSVSGEGLLLRGRIEASEGNMSAAHASFEAARRTFERLGHTRVADAGLEIARVALSDGDVAAARDVLARLPVPESPKRAAEVALVAVDIERAAGGDTLDAARRAVDQARGADDDQLLLPALVRLARAQHDVGDVESASATLGEAQQTEDRLTARVPEEAAAAWATRPDRHELAAVEARIRQACLDTHRDSVPPARASCPSSVPPPGPTSARMSEWKSRYPDIVGGSEPILGVLSMLDKVAPTDALVLVRGESGTGKELVAEALHRNSGRRDRPLIKVNCAALVETLLLSELFGHERGAFTGANSRRKGRFELADGGVIFLDEIGDISPKTQVALLRVLQERQFERVGGTQPIRVDVRIVAATHRDLEQMVRDGTFREDLYYRLRGVMIEMPPLRRRLDDLGELAKHLLARIAAERGDAPCILSPEALALLSRHSWPGNVRELENVLRSATLFADSDVLTPLDFAAFAETFRAGDPEPEVAAVPAADAPEPAALEDLVYSRVRMGDHSLFDMKKELERECIVRALAETDGNITQAASLLGMKRPRLSQLVKQYGLSQSPQPHPAEK